MPEILELYGLYGFTHGWGTVLTVMSPAGASAALRAVPGNPDLIVQAGAGQLTRYREKRGGALARLVDAHGIVVLAKPAWDARKTEFAEKIYS